MSHVGEEKAPTYSRVDPDVRCGGQANVSRDERLDRAPERDPLVSLPAVVGSDPGHDDRLRTAVHADRTEDARTPRAPLCEVCGGGAVRCAGATGEGIAGDLEHACEEHLVCAKGL
jgi:hypothetical protein